ncbi:hypothetical protein ZIOFF_054529 [Zingiber officinale]|uniref:Uncharacterized protein n=1 Tax=Zingiber officinale TaxID=94328 RepID=A0A8J5FKJ0_ZINOF|nr:hypothetical protein ZIOFF_054529 [Zingiber officinale]
MRLRPKLPRFLPSLLVSRLLADAAGIFQFLPLFGSRCWRRRGLLIPWRLPIAAPPRHRPAIRPDLAGFHQSHCASTMHAAIRSSIPRFVDGWLCLPFLP